MEYKLASFTNGFAALIIDGILIHVAAKFLTFPFGFGFNPWNVFNGNFLDFAEYSGYVGVIALVYYGIFLSQCHHWQTGDANQSP